MAALVSSVQGRRSGGQIGVLLKGEEMERRGIQIWRSDWSATEGGGDGEEGYSDLEGQSWGMRAGATVDYYREAQYL
uniref:SJCHGC09740 protein n=1 Tax=Schistosoma japonicum TaxID=6182 RepID=Q5BR03_SCHJA|nr:SJCHGC09740 protein [Schistosoma japonicum]